MTGAGTIGQPASAAGQMVNAPNAGAAVAIVVKSAVLVPLFSAGVLLLFNRFGGFSVTGWLETMLVVGGMYLLLTGVMALTEPMLLITPDAIAVRHWGTRLFKTGDPWMKYPMQPVSPRLRRGGRGGSWIQLVLRDVSGLDHTLRFQLANFESLQLALMAAGCQVVLCSAS